MNEEDCHKLQEAEMQERRAEWEAWQAASDRLAAQILERRGGQPIDVDAIWEEMREELEHRHDYLIEEYIRAQKADVHDSILQLYPLPSQEHPLTGLYLSHNLRQHSQAANKPYVYANFVASLDGRIAVPDPTRLSLMVPEPTANDRDWRLFQELAAQADLIITSGRYLRDWADGRAQKILQVGDPRFADLREWRKNQGLPPQPDLAIISATLRFPIPDVLTAGGRKAVVFTIANPDPERAREIEAKAGPLFVAGEESVAGDRMVAQMAELGYRTIYSAAGPQILHLLLSGGVLDRLYLTHANRLLGGQAYATIVEGEFFPMPIDMTLNAVYYDPHGLDGLGQLFVSYDRGR